MPAVFILHLGQVIMGDSLVVLIPEKTSVQQIIRSKIINGANIVMTIGLKKLIILSGHPQKPLKAKQLEPVNII